MVQDNIAVHGAKEGTNNNILWEHAADVEPKATSTNWVMGSKSKLK